MESKSEVKIQRLRGMQDIFPPETHFWRHVYAAVCRVFSNYGYEEIQTPILEASELFMRTMGESGIVVDKEMYAFLDKNGESVSLRPEGTASVVRAYIESGAAKTEPVARYYYMGPMFRYERPQKGRQREFYQIGLELLGVENPLADVEAIASFTHLLSELGIKDIDLEINSIGCNDCRPPYNKKLLTFLEGVKSSVCDDCVKRIGRNPLRVFDCKNDKCINKLKEAPSIKDFWCGVCKDHFDAVQNGLETVGVSFIVNNRIVRGLDYYQKTAFEFTSKSLGSQNAVAAGGRYDGLVKSLGGPDIPGVGYAIGVERLILLAQGAQKDMKSKKDIVYFAVMGSSLAKEIMPVIQTLRKDGVRVEWDFGERSLKSQMRSADKCGAESVVIFGEDEFKKGRAIVRNMRTKAQHEVELKDIPMHFVRIDS